MAGAEEVIDIATDDLETAPDAVPFPGPHAESGQDVGSQAGRPTVPGLCSEPSDRRERELALLGMESNDQTTPQEFQDTHQHDADATACEGAGGNVQEPRPGVMLQVASDPPGHPHMPLETAALPEGGSGVGAFEPALPQQRLDPPWDNAQAACPAPMRTGGLHPAGTWPADQEREGQRQDQADEPSIQDNVTPSLAVLLHVMSHLRLRNDSNWCYVNSTIFCVLWTLMSMQCDSASLRERFEDLIQFLPCHNLQLVALSELPWFDQILQAWEAFQGTQRGMQQDTSEYAAAVLCWLRAPAVNMTWERRVEEMGSVCTHDHGDAYMPITLSLPASHAILPEQQYNLSSLVWRWMQEHGMIAALTQAPQCLCLHLDRFYQVDGEVHKSQCMIDMEAGCTMPVFTKTSLQREMVEYVLVAAAAHLGSDKGGHYRAALKTCPAVQLTGQPMHWLITNDDVEATPTWKMPDWFCHNTTVLWLLRADSVHLHAYQALPAQDPVQIDAAHGPSTPDPPNDSMPVRDNDAGSPAAVPKPDAMTEAILAMLQTTTMAERQR